MHTSHLLAILLAGHLLATAFAAAGSRKLLAVAAASVSGGPDSLAHSQQQTRLRSADAVEPMAAFKSFEMAAHTPDGAAGHPLAPHPQQVSKTGARRRLSSQYQDLVDSRMRGSWGQKPKTPLKPANAFAGVEEINRERAGAGPSAVLAHTSAAGFVSDSGARKLRAVQLLDRTAVHAKPCFTSETCTRTVVLQ